MSLLPILLACLQVAIFELSVLNALTLDFLTPEGRLHFAQKARVVVVCCAGCGLSCAQVTGAHPRFWGLYGITLITLHLLSYYWLDARVQTLQHWMPYVASASRWTPEDLQQLKTFFTRHPQQLPTFLGLVTLHELEHGSCKRAGRIWRHEYELWHVAQSHEPGE